MPYIGIQQLCKKQVWKSVYRIQWTATQYLPNFLFTYLLIAYHSKGIDQIFDDNYYQQFRVLLHKKEKIVQAKDFVGISHIHTLIFIFRHFHYLYKTERFIVAFVSMMHSKRYFGKWCFPFSCLYGLLLTLFLYICCI